MRYLRAILIIMALVPFVTFAVDPEGIVTCTGPDCNWCTLVGLIDSIINWLFGFFVLAAVMMAMYVGFKLVVSQGNASAWEEAKKHFSNLIIGFVIFISAWLVVDTILKMTIDPKLDFGPWNELGGSNCSVEDRR